MNGMADSFSRHIYLTFPEDGTFREEDVSNYFRDIQHMDMVEFSAYGSPTGLDLRYPCDLHVEARMLQNCQDILWRSKLDCIEPLDCRSRGCLIRQVRDVKRSNHHRAISTGSVISSLMHSPNFYDRGVMLSSSEQRRPKFHEDTTIVEENGNEAVVYAPPPTNNLMPSLSILDLVSLKSYYFQVPRNLRKPKL